MLYRRCSRCVQVGVLHRCYYLSTQHQSVLETSLPEKGGLFITLYEIECERKAFARSRQAVYLQQ